MNSFFFYLLSLSLLAAIPLKEEHWDQLKGHVDQEIVVRGFISEQENGQWALSSHPPVRSCCRHLKSQDEVFLLLDGDWSAVEASRVVEVRGQLSQTRGEGFASLRLGNCRLEESTTEIAWGQLALALGATAFAGIALFLRRR